MLDRMKLRTKIILLVVAALLGMVVIASLSAFATKRDLTEGRNQEATFLDRAEALAKTSSSEEDKLDVLLARAAHASKERLYAHL